MKILLLQDVKKLAGCGSFIRTTHGGYTFVSQKENDPA